MFFLESYKRATTILSSSEYSSIKVTATAAAITSSRSSTSSTSSMLDWTCTRGSNTTGLPMMDTFSGIGCFQGPTSCWLSMTDDDTISEASTPPASTTTAAPTTTTTTSIDMDMTDDACTAVVKSITTAAAAEETKNKEEKYWSVNSFVQSSYSEDSQPPSWVEVKIGFPETNGKGDSHLWHPPPTPPATPPVPEYHVYPSAAAHSTPLIRKSTPRPAKAGGSPKSPLRELNVSKVTKVRSINTSPSAFSASIDRNRRSGAPSPTSSVSSAGTSIVRKSHSVPPKIGDHATHRSACNKYAGYNDDGRRGPVEQAFECVYYSRPGRNGKKVYGSVTTFSGGSTGGGSVREKKQHDQREKRLAAAYEAGFLEHLFGKKSSNSNNNSGASTPTKTPASPKIEERVVDISDDIDMDMDMEQDITGSGPAPAPTPTPSANEKKTAIIVPAPVDIATPPPAEGDEIMELRRRFEKVLK